MLLLFLTFGHLPVELISLSQDLHLGNLSRVDFPTWFAPSLVFYNVTKLMLRGGHTVTGFSVFCLANQKSADFTRIFGGSNGNEGLGLLSFCLDWQYIR